jgi:hypothetical protein
MRMVSIVTPELGTPPSHSEVKLCSTVKVWAYAAGLSDATSVIKLKQTTVFRFMACSKDG